jgi:hypothetical protein
MKHLYKNTNDIIYKNDLILYKKLNTLITDNFEKLDDNKLSVLFDVLNTTIIRIQEYEKGKSIKEMYDF